MKETICVYVNASMRMVRRSLVVSSEPEAWEPRPHIILEEMHRQQRGTRCNTLMNKYAEGWNWSLVLSGGGKKKRRNKYEQSPCNLVSGTEACDDPWEMLSIVGDGTFWFLPLQSDYCLFLFYVSTISQIKNCPSFTVWITMVACALVCVSLLFFLIHYGDASTT